MSRLLLIIFSFSFSQLRAQELFVYTEPASNMAARGIGFRVDQYLMKGQQPPAPGNYYLSPSVMWGISKNIMIHLNSYASNTTGKFKFEGSGLYLKYRFYSIDDVHSHFRMAGFARLSKHSRPIHHYALNLDGNNSGYETGIVATQLINKLALSATASFAHATDNGKQKFKFDDRFRNALNYSFSTGKLFLPKAYRNYKQVNMNGMLEFLGQSNLSNGYAYLDAAPSLQFIINSQVRVDLGYRFPLYSKMPRGNDRGGLLRLEYNLFNVY